MFSGTFKWLAIATAHLVPVCTHAHICEHYTCLIHREYLCPGPWSCLLCVCERHLNMEFIYSFLMSHAILNQISHIFFLWNNRSVTMKTMFHDFIVGIYIYIYIYIYTHTHTHTYIHTYTYIIIYIWYKSFVRHWFWKHCVLVCILSLHFLNRVLWWASIFNFVEIHFIHVPLQKVLYPLSLKKQKWAGRGGTHF
jgi:hypothetical protein